MRKKREKEIFVFLNSDALGDSYGDFRNQKNVLMLYAHE